MFRTTTRSRFNRRCPARVGSADAALESALAIAQSNTEESELLRFTIIGMGKLGAQELNYVSDVDLIYVVEPMAETMSQPQLVKSVRRSPCSCRRSANR